MEKSEFQTGSRLEALMKPNTPPEILNNFPEMFYLKYEINETLISGSKGEKKETDII